MRVYELAKQLGMENRELIPELKRLGIPVASHSSALDDDSVRVALEKLSSKARGGEASSAGHEAKKMVRSSKEPGVSHEEPAKPDKKRILSKKKREEGAEDAVAPLAAAEAAFSSTAPTGADAAAVLPAMVSGAEVVEGIPTEPAPPTGPDGGMSPVVSLPSSQLAEC